MGVNAIGLVDIYRAFVLLTSRTGWPTIGGLTLWAMADASPQKCRTTWLLTRNNIHFRLYGDIMTPASAAGEWSTAKNIKKVMTNHSSNSESSCKIKGWGFFVGLFFLSEWSKAEANSSFRLVLALSFFGRYEEWKLAEFQTKAKILPWVFGFSVWDLKKTH